MPEDARRFGSGPCGFRSGERGVKVETAGEGGVWVAEEVWGKRQVVGEGEGNVLVEGEL